MDHAIKQPPAWHDCVLRVKWPQIYHSSWLDGWTLSCDSKRHGVNKPSLLGITTPKQHKIKHSKRHLIYIIPQYKNYKKTGIYQHFWQQWCPPTSWSMGNKKMRWIVDKTDNNYYTCVIWIKIGVIISRILCTYNWSECETSFWFCEEDYANKTCNWVKCSLRTAGWSQA